MLKKLTRTIIKKDPNKFYNINIDCRTYGQQDNAKKFFCTNCYSFRPKTSKVCDCQKDGNYYPANDNNRTTNIYFNYRQETISRQIIKKIDFSSNSFTCILENIKITVSVNANNKSIFSSSTEEIVVNIKRKNNQAIKSMTCDGESIPPTKANFKHYSSNIINSEMFDEANMNPCYFFYDDFLWEMYKLYQNHPLLIKYKLVKLSSECNYEECIKKMKKNDLYAEAVYKLLDNDMTNIDYYLPYSSEHFFALRKVVEEKVTNTLIVTTHYQKILKGAYELNYTVEEFKKLFELIDRDNSDLHQISKLFESYHTISLFDYPIEKTPEDLQIYANKTNAFFKYVDDPMFSSNYYGLDTSSIYVKGCNVLNPVDTIKFIVKDNFDFISELLYQYNFNDRMAFYKIENNNIIIGHDFKKYIVYKDYKMIKECKNYNEMEEVLENAISL